MKKKLYAFDTPIETFFKLPDNILVYWKNVESVFFGCNDLLADLGCLTNQTIAGTQDSDFMDADSAVKLVANDPSVLNTNSSQVFLETVNYNSKVTYQSLSFKSVLTDSAQQIKGTFGFSVILGDPFFSKIFKVIQKLKLTEHLLPPILLISTEQQKELTEKERACLYQLMKGKSTKEIADILGNSPRTIETHLENIKSKLHCYHRSQIIEKAFEEIIL